MKQSKKLTKKDKEQAKKISNIALIVFFAHYIIYPRSFHLISNIIAGIMFLNSMAINRYVGLGISIYGYFKYKNCKYSHNVMILCIVLQALSLIWLAIIFAADFGKWG